MITHRDPENVTVPPEDVRNEDDVRALHWKRKLYWFPVKPNIHAALAFMFEVEPRTLPAAIVGNASITPDRFIMCDAVSPSGEHHMGAFLTSTREFLSELERAMRHTFFTDEEKAELQETLNGWIGNDYSGGGLKLA